MTEGVCPPLEPACTPLERTAQYTYDRLSRLIQITAPDPDGVGAQSPLATLFTYDEVDNLLSAQDVLLPSGTATPQVLRETRFSYDQLNRKTQTIRGFGSPAQVATVWESDELGNIVAIVEAAGDPQLQRRTAYAYDTLNRLEMTTFADPDGAGGPQASLVTTYAYDDFGNVTDTTEAPGTSQQRITRFDYDDLNRLTRLTRPEQPVFEYKYDAVDKLAMHTMTLTDWSARRRQWTRYLHEPPRSNLTHWAGAWQWWTCSDIGPLTTSTSSTA
jgi:YD repeat-containing protein